MTPIESLRVVYVDELCEVDAATQLSFGRQADLVIDANPHLHRRLGVFCADASGWVLHNTGSVIPLAVSDRGTPSRMTVAPGASVVLTFAQCTVSFRAGDIAYELQVTNPAVAPPTNWEAPGHGADTVTAVDLHLNTEQRLLLVGLGALRLADRSAPVTTIASNRSVATQLGWTITKFNRKLDYLCLRFADAGVSGLVGDSAGLANRRRERLVEYVLNAGLISERDLALLD